MHVLTLFVKISECTVNKDNFNTILVSLDRALTYRKK